MVDTVEAACRTLVRVHHLHAAVKRTLPGDSVVIIPKGAVWPQGEHGGRLP